ncbi:SpoIID/LytB domain protein [Anaeromyxobacter dehalogenans 2CP-1]|uniref:SpoIID/LytB domain protein n=1 Tax=Anaeromyxobacter dehalogenans (strain ATCC BAA-258 / DSM 21875 / 2CP-1) TaxID=455488 RepID=B8JEM9_ANAD2|nr:SpoIID/LytB domain-containing protein [Anaeromyxobacter dehalogenans]ACL66175.1 SpoIID/LytB domain protein [Anaeromyxobacter dehalogenans 2CP-1]
MGRLLAVLLAVALAAEAAPTAPGAVPEPAAPAELPAIPPPEPAAPALPAAAPPAEPAASTPVASTPDAAPEPATPLPLPLPPPDAAVLAPPPAADLADPLDLLWGHRLEFAPGGEPLVTIRLMEGQREIAFRPLARARVLLRGGGELRVEAGTRLRVRAREAVPAVLAWRALLEEAPLADRARLEAEARAWRVRGVRAEPRVVGAVYGIAGRVVDNRRALLLVDGDGTEAGARATVETLRAAHGARATLHATLVGRPSGRLELLGDGGAPLGEADAALTLAVEGEAGFLVEGVEHEHGRGGRAREDRTYRGRLYLTLDAGGALAAVHGVPLEELLRGLVPSEMPASSPRAALEAQAVTARSNVLAQIGTRHLTDPFMLCAEVHCQAYRGDAARTGRTDAAVLATRGEALFGRADRTLVNAVYSAMCGGHGEHNDAVWDGTPDPSLRGRPDLPPAAAARWPVGVGTDALVRRFLVAGSEAYCARAAGASRSRFRWTRRLDAAALARVGAELGIGPATALRVTARGVSGRARELEVTGAAGRAEVRGELRIRRLLGGLPSAMFLVEPEPGGALALRGGGWGHGAGMCQWGAVGRAEAGQDHREILRAYYSGAEVSSIY